MPSTTRFYVRLRQRLAQMLLLHRNRQVIQPGLHLRPNPCTARDVLTMQLIGIRSCPVQVQLCDTTGRVLTERPVFPLTDNHRLPLVLPHECRPGMYQVVARQATGKTFRCWVALLEEVL